MTVRSIHRAEDAKVDVGVERFVVVFIVGCKYLNLNVRTVIVESIEEEQSVTQSVTEYTHTYTSAQTFQ